MSTVNILDPTTFEVPSDQVLLYTETVNEELKYKYKLSTGDTGTIEVAKVRALGIDPDVEGTLPALVFLTDFTACLNTQYATLGDMTVAVSTKASISYVRNVAATKLNKYVFLNKLAELATISMLTSGLNTKADESDVQSWLNGKADASTTYTKTEVDELISGVGPNSGGIDVTGTAGQFVVIGSNGKPVAQTVTIPQGTVISVNNVSPDANGNVTLTIPQGTVTSINNVSPDSNGNVSLTIPQGTVTSVNNVSPVNGNVSLTIPTDISDLADSTNILSGKQATITGTEGQFVRINSSGAAEAQTVDLTVFGTVKSVNNQSPDNNGNVSLTIPSDISDLNDASNIISSKQSAITGTEGQFVRINSSGVAEAQTVDLSSFGSVKSVNNVSPDSNGNITLNIPNGGGSGATDLILHRPVIDEPVFLKIYISSTGSTESKTLIVDTTTSAGRALCKVYELSYGVGEWVDFPSNGLTVDYEHAAVRIDLSNVSGLPGYIFYRWETSNGSDREFESTYFPSVSNNTPGSIVISSNYFTGTTVGEVVDEIGEQLDGLLELLEGI